MLNQKPSGRPGCVIDTRIYKEKKRTRNSVRARATKAKTTQGKINRQDTSEPTSDV